MLNILVSASPETPFYCHSREQGELRSKREHPGAGMNTVTKSSISGWKLVTYLSTHDYFNEAYSRFN
jgi:hypothetical protein